MKHFLFFTILGFISIEATKAQTVQSSSLIVQTKQGKVNGTTDNGSFVWRGIQYAKAPIGNLRFKAPQPVESWEGIKNATEFGPIVPQIQSSYAEGKCNEDCLYLNVWSPAADNKKRPVMLWIHGGGFSQGAGSNAMYNGSELVKKGDVIVVTINYRLGPLAFLYFNDILPNNTDFESNLGIKDQIAALKWVKENIESFGGDPNKVTIFGQSSGATSVMTIMSCPSAKGLFNHAIAESPSLNFWTTSEATSVTKKFLSMLGISENNLTQLFKISTDSLNNVAERMLVDRNNMPGIGIFSPTVDGTFLPQKPIDAIKSGQTKDVPLLIGTNKYEANLFKAFSRAPIPRSKEELHDRFSLKAPLEEERITKSYTHYPKEQAVLNIVTDGVFTIPSIKAAEAQITNAPTWMYRMDWESLPLKLKGLRTCHALEIFFVFNTFKEGVGKKVTMLTNKKKVYKISNEMQDAWINFAKTGNPNNPSSDVWKTYDAKDRATMLFDKTTRLVSDPNAKQRTSWADAKFF